MRLPTGMVTFLFTDVVGSSSRWERATEEMRGSIRRHDELLHTAIAAHAGHVVKKMGDGFMAVFEDPADAVSAVVQAQIALGDESWAETLGGLESRMGIHTGPAELDGDDYVGPTVNRAARLEAAGHGGQVLVSTATRELVADRVPEVRFRDLGEHHLRGLSRPERVYQIDAPDLPHEFPPLRTESTPTNLPSALQQMVGRHAELEAVMKALRDSRLVTITGAGGAGKTMLAIEVARRFTGDHPAGVWLIELAGLTDGRRIPTEILGTMRRPAAADRDHLEVLIESLQGQQALLVIDNCEHLLSDVAQLASRVLRGAGGTTILATSREPLGISGERAWHIPTMSLPAEPTVEAVLGSDAGALFAACARTADASFAVSDDNAQVVSNLCHRLDGLPLAIELACARLRSMNVDNLSRRLDDRFKLLRGGATDQVAHHRTLRDTVAWSYDLLTGSEQRLYRRLSVFAGGFDLEAAEAVEAEVAGDDEVIDLLDPLVAQSLVQHHQGRYRMLETIRQFGAELLGQHEESEAAARAHLNWLSDLARAGGRELEGKDQLIWLRRFQTEIDNIRAGLVWALENDPVAGAMVIGSLTLFFWMNAMEADTHQMTDSRSFLAEGYDWATALLDAAGDDLPAKIRARLQSGLGGMLCVRSGRYREGVERLAEAQALFEELDDARGLGWAVFYDGVAGWGLRPMQESIKIFRRSLEIHEKSDDKAGQLFASLLLGTTLGVAGEYDEGRLYVERFAQGANAIKVPNMLAHAADALGMFDALQDQVTDETARRSAESLEAFRSINNYACLTHALGSAAMVLARMGDLEAPGIVIGMSQAIRERLNMVLAPYEDRSEIAANIASTAMALDILQEGSARDSWEAAVARGRTMEPDEGIHWTIRRLGHEPAPNIP